MMQIKSSPLVPLLVLLIVVVWSCCDGCSAWILSSARSTTRTTTQLFQVSRPFSYPGTSGGTAGQSSSSSNNSNSNSNSNIQEEIRSGRVMEGGQVIDFSSVKASSRAEQALADARNQLLSTKATKIATTTAAGARISATSSHQRPSLLGINKDVIAEVGHSLGEFATAHEIQECAAYLRSMAPAALGFSTASSTPTNYYSAADRERFNALIDRAYEESGEVTSAFAKTFYLGTQFLPMEARKAIWAVYVWCRRTDEIVDYADQEQAALSNEEKNKNMLLELAAWEMRLENIWNKGQVEDVYELCLLHVLVRYPTLDIVPFQDMLRGMLMDVPDLGQERYNNFDELHLYCYRVAGTVGLMSLPIFGCAPGYTYEVSREPALSLGVAFQLTNILRDVGEDAVQRGRVYLPQDDLARFGVTEEQIMEQRVDDNYINLMKFQIERARMYYERARRGVFMLAPQSRLPVQASLDAYSKILDKIEANGYDSLNQRAYVGKWEKLSMVPMSWYKTLDISRTIPAPGDKPLPSLDQI